MRLTFLDSHLLQGGFQPDSHLNTLVLWFSGTEVYSSRCNCRQMQLAWSQNLSIYQSFLYYNLRFSANYRLAILRPYFRKRPSVITSNTRSLNWRLVLVSQQEILRISRPDSMISSMKNGTWLGISHAAYAVLPNRRPALTCQPNMQVSLELTVRYLVWGIVADGIREPIIWRYTDLMYGFNSCHIWSRRLDQVSPYVKSASIVRATKTPKENAKSSSSRHMICWFIWANVSNTNLKEFDLSIALLVSTMPFWH